MAFVVALALEEATLLLGSAIAEVGVGETVGGAVAGYLSSTVVDVVGKKIEDKLIDVTKNVIGEENYNKVTQGISETKENLNDVFSWWWSGNTDAMIKRQQDREQRNTSAFNAFNSAEAKQLPVATPVPIDVKLPVAIKDPLYMEPGETSTKYTTVQLADLVVTHGSIIATQGLEGSVEKLVATDDDKLNLVKKLSSFYASKTVEDDAEFQDIAKVYNMKMNSTGRFIGPTDMTIEYSQAYDGLVMSCVNEVGEIISMGQTKGFTLPSIYGVYGGPFSINNRRSEDVMDTAFFFHDAAYTTQGYFNARADAELVSRLLQTKELWPRGSVTLLNSIIIYFTTVGKSFSLLKGSLPDNVAIEPVPQMTKDDIFPVLVPESDTYPTDKYIIERYNFYHELEDDVKTALTTSSIFAESGFGANLRLQQEFLNFDIVLV